MNSRSFNSGTEPQAFTRMDLLVVVVVVTLLAAVVLPALASNRTRSDRVVCANNLRQIGIALQIWGNNHGDQILWNVDMVEGGTRLHPLSANTWFHFAWLSNELASPRIVFCPSDTGRPALDFTGDPAVGYIHPNFANRATSYFLNAHPYGRLPGEEMLAGDRNLPTQGASSTCSMLAAVSTTRACPVPLSFGWTNGLHGTSAGNLLMFDSRVEQADNERLRAAIDYPCRLRSDQLGGGNAHFAIPR